MKCWKCMGIAALVIVFLVGCDPNTEINKVFADAGLNRLAVVRDDIQPGGLVLSSDKGATYADNMLDYVNAEPGAIQIPITAGDQTSNFQAVMSKYKGDRSVDASLAVKFIQSVIPIDISNSLKLKTSVNIDLIDARVKRMKIPMIQRFLGSNASLPFRTAVTNFTRDKKTKAYLIYEIWQANKMKITSSSNTDITDSIDVGKTQVISSAQGKFSLSRTFERELELSGDKFYVFAVRTGELQVANGEISFKPMNFTPAKGLGIKGAGGDESFSAIVNPNFEALVLGSNIQ